MELSLQTINHSKVVILGVHLGIRSKLNRLARNVVKVPTVKTSEDRQRKNVVSSDSAEAGFPPTPDQDLVFRGGNTIPDLNFVNFYIDDSSSWNQNEIKSIDSALAAAMSDKNLNNVMVQYFPGRGNITTTFRGSDLLPGNNQDRFFKGDVEKLVSDLFSQRKLDKHDLKNTVFNFLLPSGKMLSSLQSPGDVSSASGASQMKRGSDVEGGEAHEEADSSNGLGGYHGSIHTQDQGGQVIYYSVAVYSEKLADGTNNGIVAFDTPWKSVVGTLYHELNEARTYPDVEDANKNNNNGLIGWTSNNGDECGDYPITEANPDLSRVFKEVPLTNGNGSVPIQFQYSNAIHGPEGPIPSPHSN